MFESDVSVIAPARLSCVNLSSKMPVCIEGRQDKAFSFVTDRKGYISQTLFACRGGGRSRRKLAFFASLGFCECDPRRDEHRPAQRQEATDRSNDAGRPVPSDPE